MNNKMNGILESLGVDPFYLFIVVFVLLAVLFILYVLLNERYRKLQRCGNLLKCESILCRRNTTTK